VPHYYRLRVAVWCTAPWSGWPSWRILLLARRRSESCVRLGAASWVVAWDPLVSRTSASRVGLTEDWGCTVAGMVTSHRPGLPQHRGWRCSAWDGSTMVGMAAQDRSWRRRHVPLVRRHGVVPCGRGVGVHTLFEGSAVLLRGVRRAGRTGVGGTVSRS
jgi:hypothetical protein